MKDYKRIEHMRNLNDSLIWERMKRCYDYGYEDGKADTPFTDTEEAEKKAYNRGLNEAWKAAKKIHDGQISYEVFGLDKTGNGLSYASPLNWGETITAQEVIAKIKKYEDKQKQDAEIFDVDHTCEEKQEQTRDEKMIDDINFAINATDSQDDYSMGMRNGMRYVKSLIDGKEPQYELRWTDEEIKLGIDLGDEVISDYGAKGIVVGIDTYKGEVMLSLLMGNHKVPQLVKASGFKTKTSRHFPQIIEVLEQIKGEADG